jgi:hypothetical protein
LSAWTHFADGGPGSACPAIPEKLSNFAPDLTPTFPGDVDVTMQKQLESQQQFAEVQRLFDLSAWQMFLAVNWPTTDAGEPLPSITDFSPENEPHWTLEQWVSSSQIYRADGRRPKGLVT